MRGAECTHYVKGGCCSALTMSKEVAAMESMGEDDCMEYHIVGPGPINPNGPWRGYFDFGDGRIAPIALTEAERLQAIADSKRRTRERLLAAAQPHRADRR